MSKAKMFDFEKLDVWQKSIAFADLVYNHTRNFPADERFGLTNQMRNRSHAQRASKVVNPDVKRWAFLRDYQLSIQL